MSYEIVRIDEFGTIVKDFMIQDNCEVCKYQENEPQYKPCKGCNMSITYYLKDKEAAKLETELTPETFTLNDMYVTSKQLFDCQDKLKDLQIENKKLKEKIASLNEYLDNRISECDYVKKEMNLDNLDTQGIIHIENSYQNVKEFIKNQK